MAPIPRRPACVFILTLLLSVSSLAGFDIDSLLQQVSDTDFSSYLDGEMGNKRQFIRIRSDFNTIDKNLKLTFPFGLSLKHRDKIYKEELQEERSSFKWENKRISIISGYGTMHINQGILRGRTMKRQSSRFSGFVLPGAIKIRSDPALWNKELKSISMKGNYASIHLIHYDGQLSSGIHVNHKKIKTGIFLHDIETYLSEFWMNRKDKNKTFLSGFSVQKNKEINHVNLAWYHKNNGLDYGLNVLFLSDNFQQISSDSPWGSTSKNSSISTNTSLSMTIPKGGRAGFSFILGLKKYEKPLLSVISDVENKWKNYSLYLKFKYLMIPGSKIEEKWPWLEQNDDQRRTEVSSSFTYKFTKKITYKTVCLFRPGRVDYYWLHRMQGKQGNFKVLFQLMRGYSEEDPIYAPRPYVGTSYLSEYIRSQEKHVDIRINYAMKMLKLSLFVSKSNQEFKSIFQLQIDLK